MNGCSLLVYSTRNLGDMIQTLALSQHFPPAAGVLRHRMQKADRGRLLVVNGVLFRDAPPRPTPPCLFAGVSGPYYRTQAYLDWLRQSPNSVGARDPASLRVLQNAGIAAALIGCATLTLPRYGGPRAGVVSVDYDGPGERLTHYISRSDKVEWQWQRAQQVLERYRQAEAVYTARLHVALPCLAMGTPVWIARPSRTTWQPARFDLLDSLGVPYEQLTTADVTPLARRFTGFLESHLAATGALQVASGPKMPAPPPAGWLPGWLRW